MRLELTKRCELALQAMATLPHGRQVPGRDLARSIGVSTHYLPQIMTPLVKAGWVASAPGRNGGYTRTATLASVSALELIEAIEGPTDTGTCVLKGGPCDDQEQCALHVPWSRARTALLAELGRTTLAEATHPSTDTKEGRT